MLIRRNGQKFHQISIILFSSHFLDHTQRSIAGVGKASRFGLPNQNISSSSKDAIVNHVVPTKGWIRSTWNTEERKDDCRDGRPPRAAGERHRLVLCLEDDVEFSRRLWALHTQKEDRDNTKLEREGWALKNHLYQLVLNWILRLTESHSHRFGGSNLSTGLFFLWCCRTFPRPCPSVLVAADTPDKPHYGLCFPRHLVFSACAMVRLSCSSVSRPMCLAMGCASLHPPPQLPIGDFAPSLLDLS